MSHKSAFEIWLSKTRSCPVCRNPFKKDRFVEITLQDGTIEQTYQDKIAIYKGRADLFSQFRFQYNLFEFQQRIIEKIKTLLENEKHHLLISPPGSGKTIVALEICRFFSSHTLVLVPNLAVLGSWIDRLEMFIDESLSELPFTEIYTRLTGVLRPITITTYEQISESLQRYEDENNPENWGQIPDEFSKYHIKRKSYENYISRLIDHNIGFVILDEAHNLDRHLGGEILTLLDHLGQPRVLGLTATPSSLISDAYARLFDGKQTNIPLPMLVRQSVLVPFQDLTIVPPLDLTDILHYFKQSDLIDNMNKNYVLNDLIEESIKEVRFLRGVTEGGLRIHYQWLSANLSYKTVFTILIILFELRELGNVFRAMIVMDEESLPGGYNLDFRGTGGLEGVFFDLLSIREIDLLDPILITDQTLMIDRDFSDIFTSEGKIWSKRYNLRLQINVEEKTSQYALVHGSGPDWNIDTFTRFVSYLFEKGITKILLGTKSMLGEGWDSRSLNTLIDLTNSSKYEEVNQVKGRVLRFDPKWPMKTSNIWEIAPNPELTIFGSDEMRNFENRHETYFGIDPTGKIRNGIYRLNQVLTTKSFGSIDTTSQMKHIFDRAKSKETVRNLWKVDKDLGQLYYTIRISISSKTDIEGLELTHQLALLRTAIVTLLPSYISTDYDITVDEVDEERIALICEIPFDDVTKEQVQLFVDIFDKEVSSPGIAILIEYFNPIADPWYKRFISLLLGRDRRVIQQRMLIKLPFAVEIIDKKDIISSGDMNNLDAYMIKLLEDYTLPESWYLEDVGNNHIIENKREIGRKLIIQTIEDYDNNHELQLLPLVDEIYTIDIQSVILDQEYIDDTY